MDTPIRHTEAQKPPKRVFFAALIVIFFSTLSASDSIGFVPCSFDGTCVESVSIGAMPQLGSENSTATPTPEETEAAQTLPVRIKIPSANVDVPVQNPQTENMQALDTLLLKGAARFPSSAKLGVDGTVIIFAHSSRLIVRNQMFRAFNAVPDLKAGDSIELEGEDGKTYLYAVDSVEKATVETAIPLYKDAKHLVLVTCDNFTGKSARYMLKATFVGTI